MAACYSLNFVLIMKNTIAIIGECMLELSKHPATTPQTSLSAGLSYGGDTLNTAVYLARLDVKTDYVTALGDDAMSSWMIDQWQAEGVSCHLVTREKDAVPGLYMIEVDAFGERSFLYWRKDSPACRLFDDAHKASDLFAALNNFNAIYLSGITLALYSHLALERLFAFLATFREQGGQVFFDGNYRPKLWQSKKAAQLAYEKIYALTDLALPTLEDEQHVFGDDKPEDIIERIMSYGVKEVALKMGGDGCLVATQDNLQLVPSKKVPLVDTTSAGDSFNAAYLAAKLNGKTATEAAINGHDLASIVIQHRGAIVPVEAMSHL